MEESEEGRPGGAGTGRRLRSGAVPAETLPHTALVVPCLPGFLLELEPGGAGREAGGPGSWAQCVDVGTHLPTRVSRPWHRGRSASAGWELQPKGHSEGDRTRNTLSRASGPTLNLNSQPTIQVTQPAPIRATRCATDRQGTCCALGAESEGPWPGGRRPGFLAPPSPAWASEATRSGRRTGPESDRLHTGALESRTVLPASGGRPLSRCSAGRGSQPGLGVPSLSPQ